MMIELEKVNKPQILSELIAFVHKLDKYSTKKDVASILLETVSIILNAKFSSFVEKDISGLKVLCQYGESSSIKNIFTNEMSNQIFDWVTSQKQIATFKMAESSQFIFIPIVDYDFDQKIVIHGMLVLHLPYFFELKKDLNMALGIYSKLTAQSMTKFLSGQNAENVSKLQEDLKTELKQAAKIQKSISGNVEVITNKKILFNVLEYPEINSNGNIWWVKELDSDTTLVLIAQIGEIYGNNESFKGVPSALLSGYLLGEMNGLVSKREISLKPKEVLLYLNKQLNFIFKNTGISINAWYGVFNVNSRKVRFSNANHADPYLIGPEHEISNLTFNSLEKVKALGVSLDSNYVESEKHIPGGARLVICTKDLLEHAAKVGDKYDSSWLPQVLETLSALPLSEMTKNLRSILSENSNGTAHNHPRLALLLEFPS